MNTFVDKPRLYFLAKTTRNIITTLRMFGQREQQKPYFISEGTGIDVYPEEGFRADFYIYAICISGTANISLNGIPIVIKANDFFAAIPSTIVQVHQHSKDFKAKILLFERAFLLKNISDTKKVEQLGFFNYDTLAHISLQKGEALLLKQKLDAITVKSRTDGIFHDSIMQSLIINLLFETAAIYYGYMGRAPQKAFSNEEVLFMKFMKLVNAHFKDQQPLSFYAAKMFISSKYLIQISKNVAGKTPGTLIAEAMLAEAKLLLSRPEYNISMVSTALQYSSVAAFSKFFRKHTGTSPSAYKIY